MNGALVVQVKCDRHPPTEPPRYKPVQLKTAPPPAIENIISAREPIKQPLVLSAEEVARFVEAVPALRDRVALVTAHAAGLRVGATA